VLVLAAFKSVRRAAALAVAGVAFAILLAGLASPAFPHSLRAGPPAPGIPLESLAHGQMMVVSRYRSEILDLADRQTHTDTTFRRLLNYGNIQYAYCLWGLIPGSLTDEDSPFNECSHAYLAAAKALLAHMEKMPAARPDAGELISRIDADMVRGGASWVLCQYSAEQFSTGELVAPHWHDIVFHAPSLLTFLVVLLAFITAVTMIVQSPPPTDEPGS